MLISISEVLDIPVRTLLGENISESKVDDLKAISEKLEIINLKLSQRKNERKQIIHWTLISLCIIIIIITILNLKSRLYMKLYFLYSKINT